MQDDDAPRGPELGPDAIISGAPPTARLGASEIPAAPMAPSPGAKPGFVLILMLAGVTAIGPFSMQAIAPSLPSLGAALGVGEGATQSMISLAMLGMAAGAVAYGPLSDHFGRRPVLLWGLALSAVGAAAAFLAPIFELALIGRVAQAIGAGAGMVLARAAAQDLFGAQGAAAIIAKMTAVMVVAPMVAPAVGGLLTQAVGWRGVFAVICLASIGLFFWTAARFAETARSFSPELRLGAAAADYGAIVARPDWRAHAGFAALFLGSFFAFVSGGPYVLERAYGIGPGAYGAMFVLAAVIYMLANLASPRATARFGARRVMLGSAALGGAGCLGAAAFLAARGAGLEPGPDWLGAGLVYGAVGLHAVGSGLATPNAIAGAVAAYPERTGSASSLLSVAQFSAAAVAAQGAVLLALDQGAPLLVLMGALTLGAGGVFALLAPRE